MRGRAYWPWIVGGAVLGGVGWYVSQWNYAPNLMWMPPGFERVWYNTCWNRPYIRYNKGETAYGGATGTFCDSSPSQLFVSGILMGTGSIGVNVRWITIYKDGIAGASPPRMSNTEAWVRSVVPAASTAPPPRVGFGVPLDFEFPEYPYPEMLPIGKPVPVPKPKPWTVTKPRPGEQPSTRPRPVVVPVPEVPWPVHEVKPGKGPHPIVVPPIVVSPDPTTKPDVKPRPGQNPGNSPGSDPDPATPPHQQPDPTTAPPGGYRPPSREPERRPDKGRKITQRNVIHPGVMIAVNVATEGLDLLGTLYASVPDACKKKHDPRPPIGFAPKRGLTPSEKARVIYQCFDHIDIADWWANYVNNQWEDFFYGSVGRAVGQATGRLGVTTGLSRALRAAQENASQEGDDLNPLPQLEYDPETNEWSGKWDLLAAIIDKLPG